MKRSLIAVTGLMIATGVILAGCGEEGSVNEAGPEEVKLVLNWFPKAQHGGVYAGLEEGLFEDHQINLTVEPGGPQVSPIQIVAAGDADFGLAHADQLVIARNQGIELVAVAATMQGSPQAFMFHEGVEINQFEDLNGREVFIQPGITYWDFLKNEYDLSGVNELAYNGQNVTFIEKQESVTQAFVTSEPFFLEREGIPTETLLVSESGYDPYNVVLFVTKEYLEEHSTIVEQFVDSYLEGWELYKENYEEINEVITEVNPNIAVEELNYEAETQYEYIYGFDAASLGTGHMTSDKWGTLKNQLLEINLLDEDFETEEIFTTEFLPES
ncbi:ABC transporter substrate-binding protein [Alkalicoccobacillus gibsonii]|uniref:Thiamine pyrimidine synthase n=1 Tax=Alkalicoccobacillus gibsonii TaxID=79881 RepID=A0ABU9VNB6_9BACI